MKKQYFAKNDGTIHVRQAITQLLDSYQLRSKFDAASLTSSWEKLVGSYITKKTKRVSICEGTLFVEMKSASLKHDLSFMKDNLLSVLQKKFGRDAIDKIVLL